MYIRFNILVVYIIILCSTTLTSCKSEDVFRDYTKTESYNSSIIIEDMTDMAEIITAKDGARLINYKPIVNAGGNTSITLKLEGNTEYRIEVEYSSGISQSKALVPKVSDQNGYVTWLWQVGVNCKSGQYPVRIYKDSTLMFETRITVN